MKFHVAFVYLLALFPVYLPQTFFLFHTHETTVTLTWGDRLSYSYILIILISLHLLILLCSGFGWGGIYFLHST